MQQYKRWAIYIAALFLLVSATLVNNPSLYFMSAMLGCLPLISYCLGMFSLRGLVVRRIVPAVAWEGEILTLKLEVSPTGQRPHLLLRAFDTPPEPLIAERESSDIFHVTEGKPTTVDYRVTMSRRGVFNFNKLVLSAEDPIGTHSFYRAMPAESTVVVYPQPQAIPELIVSGSEKFAQRDLPIAAVKGGGVDPDGVRQYVAGDPLRRMHWKSTARTGKLNVMEFQESRAVNMAILLDCSDPNVDPADPFSPFEQCVRMAASLAQWTIRQGASISFASGTSGVPTLDVGRGIDHLYLCLDRLARVQPGQGPTASQLLSTFGPGYSQTSTVVVITSQCEEALPGIAAFLSHAGSSIVVVYAMNHEVLTPGGEESRWISSLAASRTRVVLLPRSDTGRLVPESREEYHAR